MNYTPRNKLSAPPPPKLREEDKAHLRSLVHHPGYAVILDELHRMALTAELDVYGELDKQFSEAAVLHAVNVARLAWFVLDRIEHQVERSITEEEDAQHNRAEAERKVTHPSNNEILSAE